MAQLPNPFIPNSVAHPPNSDAADTAGVTPQPPVAPAGTISDGVPLPSLSSMEMEPSVTLAQAPSGTEGAVSVSTASSDISHIHEIFAGARKLDPPMDFLEEDELPLFIRDGEHLRRWEA